jgi:hypothetical protein
MKLVCVSTPGTQFKVFRVYTAHRIGENWYISSEQLPPRTRGWGVSPVGDGLWASPPLHYDVTHPENAAMFKEVP